MVQSGNTGHMSTIYGFSTIFKSLSPFYDKLKYFLIWQFWVVGVKSAKIIS